MNLTIALITALAVTLIALAVLLKDRTRLRDYKPSKAPDDDTATGQESLATQSEVAPKDTQPVEALNESADRTWQPDALILVASDLALQWSNRTAENWFEFKLRQDRGTPLPEVSGNKELCEYLSRGEFDKVLDCSPPSMPESIARVRVIAFFDGSYLIQARDISRIMLLQNVKRDFVANASHELRTPVSVLYGYLEMMLNDLDQIDDQWHSAIGQMHEQTQRIKQIIEDMLLLSRLEDSEHEADHVFVEVVRLLDSTQKNARVLSGNEHSISVDIEDGYSLLCNVDELQSLLNNLVSNAIRYTPEQGRINISWKVEDGTGRLCVEDSGIGISEQELLRITERFYRTEPARALVPGGTGLGLAIVNHIVLRHQATMDIQSEPGKGSRFSVIFPRNRVRKETTGVDLLLN